MINYGLPKSLSCPLCILTARLFHTPPSPPPLNILSSSRRYSAINPIVMAKHIASMIVL
jgi:hypothetical protein